MTRVLREKGETGLYLEKYRGKADVETGRHRCSPKLWNAWVPEKLEEVGLRCPWSLRRDTALAGL